MSEGVGSSVVRGWKCARSGCENIDPPEDRTIIAGLMICDSCRRDLAIYSRSLSRNLDLESSIFMMKQFLRWGKDDIPKSLLNPEKSQTRLSFSLLLGFDVGGDS